MIEITSNKHLQEHLSKSNKSFVLLYKSGAEQSDCALQNFIKSNAEGIQLLRVDVAKVRDIHQKYGIKSVPSLLEFDGDIFKNNFKGCQSDQYYNNLISASLFKAKVKEEGASPQKPVKVYSTPSCSWCTTLKNHLRKNGIRYTDVDVSKNQSAAKAMQAKSGQQGVPQIQIGSEIIVGFDKNRINLLLGI